jgi:hypothetical protein
MNKKIKELAEQAKEHANHLDSIGVDASMEDIFNQKFAELIVEECLYIVEGEDDSSADTKSVRLAMIRMKQHFGVEE